MAQKPKLESSSAASNPKLTESLAARKETSGGSNGKLSLYPLSIEDALRAAARTGRVTPAKPKQPKRGKRADPTR
jgi:hypothetical protein